MFIRHMDYSLKVDSMHLSIQFCSYLYLLRVSYVCYQIPLCHMLSLGAILTSNKVLQKVIINNCDKNNCCFIQKKLTLKRLHKWNPLETYIDHFSMGKSIEKIREENYKNTGKFYTKLIGKCLQNLDLLERNWSWKSWFDLYRKLKSRLAYTPRNTDDVFKRIVAV